MGNIYGNHSIGLTDFLDMGGEGEERIINVMSTGYQLGILDRYWRSNQIKYVELQALQNF